MKGDWDIGKYFLSCMNIIDYRVLRVNRKMTSPNRRKGDINDMEAVLRAAVISEKRRSRVISMSSMTDLSERYRTTSFTSQVGVRETVLLFRV